MLVPPFVDVSAGIPDINGFVILADEIDSMHGLSFAFCAMPLGARYTAGVLLYV
jgi:hypothetical protein